MLIPILKKPYGVQLKNLDLRIKNNRIDSKFYEAVICFLNPSNFICNLIYMKPCLYYYRMLLLPAALLFLLHFSPVSAETKESGKEIKDRIVPVPEDWIDTTPVRGESRPLIYERTGFTYKCNECHEDFKTPVKSNDPKGEHKNLMFDHGMNLNCLSCHHPDNRNSFVDHDGSEIPRDKPTQLCSKCHGPVYKDWKSGVHGRLNGYWNLSFGSRTKLACNQCHDPHRPAFQKMAPMPPPAVSRINHLKKGLKHE